MLAVAIMQTTPAISWYQRLESDDWLGESVAEGLLMACSWLREYCGEKSGHWHFDVSYLLMAIPADGLESIEINRSSGAE